MASEQDLKDNDSKQIFRVAQMLLVTWILRQQHLKATKIELDLFARAKISNNFTG